MRFRALYEKSSKIEETANIPSFRAPTLNFSAFFLEISLFPNAASATLPSKFLQDSPGRVVFFIGGAIIRNESFRRSRRQDDSHSLEKTARVVATVRASILIYAKDP